MKRYLPIVLLCFVVAGCLKTRAELADEDSGQQQQSQTATQQRAQQKAVPPPPAADRFEEYDEQMRQLSGRVDSLENGMAQVNSVKQSDKDQTAKEKELIEQKFVAYEAALNKLETQVAALTDDVAKLKAPPPETTVTPGTKGRSSYDMGEEQFTAKRWKEAIVSYQKYRDANPRGKLFADASYKIGVCFQELGMKEESRAFLEEVMAKFPNSKEAKKAAFRLKSLK